MRRFYSRGAWAFLSALLIVLGLVWGGPEGVQPSAVHLSEKRLNHILYGDRSGGGHLHGQGKPCKSEFPKDWDAQEIVAALEKVAANDNLPLKKQKNGYHIREQLVEGVKIRVVLGRGGRDVITAYPTNLPRNPCLAAANDNSAE
jgi:hypothetical protein